VFDDFPNESRLDLGLAGRAVANPSGESLVRTRSVVEANVLRHETPQVRFAQDQDVVE
jgi:hypothetical protein